MENINIQEKGFNTFREGERWKYGQSRQKRKEERER